MGIMFFYHISKVCDSFFAAYIPKCFPENRACPPSLFSCGDGVHCVPKRFLCDGAKDCPNGNDEKGCQSEDIRKMFFEVYFVIDFMKLNKSNNFFVNILLFYCCLEYSDLCTGYPGRNVTPHNYRVIQDLLETVLPWVHVTRKYTRA